MSPVDLKAVREGDMVFVRGEVSSDIRYNDGGITRQNVFFGKTIVGVDVRDIAAVESRPLAVAIA